MSDTLQQAIEAIKAGDEATGEKLLEQVLAADPKNESALLWKFKVADTYEARLHCVKQALAINPNSQWARRGLRILEMEVSRPHPGQSFGGAQSAISAKPAAVNQPNKDQTKQPGPELTVPIQTDETSAPAHPSGATDAFISYSRKDKPFVQKLYEVLQESDREVWIDWGNIPLTADWRQEIREGIERANAVIFVMSPDFLTSKECQAELEQAEGYNKRLIPVVYRDVNPADVPPSLAALNWIFFRQEDDFDKSFQALFRALDTDLDWVKTHTRLLVRAVEWDNEGRNSSFLLRGDDLKEAELAVAQSDKNPSPTPLQKQYILASRQNATRRQGIMLAAATIGLVIAAALAILAYTNFLEAQRQTEIAHRKAQLALSRQLAAQSVAYADDELDLALLLNLEAGRIAEDVDARHQVDLLAGLSYSPYLAKFLHGHQDLIRTLAFSPDGQTIASGSRDKTIILWNAETGQPLGAPLTGHSDWVHSVAFSPDGQTLASGSRDTTIRLWDVSTRQPVGQPLTGHTDEIWTVAFSPDGKLLASGGADNTIRLWDVATGQPAGKPLAGHQDTVRELKFSADGRTLVSGSADNVVIQWDLPSGQPLAPPVTADLAGVWWSVVFSPDGNMMASGGDESTVVLWEADSGQPIGSPLIGHSAAVYNLVFSPDGQVLASAGDDKNIILWNTATGRALGPPLTGHTGWISALAFSPDGQTLASGGADNNIILWDLNAEQILAGHTNWVYSVAFSPDGRTLASGSYDESIILWDVVDRYAGQSTHDEQLVRHTAPIRSVAYSPNTPEGTGGKILASASEDKTIILWDTATNQPIGQPLTGHADKVKSVAFSPNGKILASGSSDGVIMLWNVEMGELIGQFPAVHTNELTSIAFSPDGQTIASGSDDKTVALYDVPTLQPLGDPLTGHTDWVNTVAFAPDGKILASGSADSTIILWDVATRQPLGPPLTGHTNRVWSVAFSPDGKILASGSADNAIILWDVETRQPVGPPLTGHVNLVRGLAFSPNGQTLASASADNSVILWNLELEAWPVRACRIANRNLTRKEWEQFIGAEHEYHLTCPDLPVPQEETTISAAN